MRARVAELNELVAVLLGKVANLEKVLGRDASNSGMPPSSDTGTAKSKRPENASRAARKKLGRGQGKQPGAPGATLAQVADPDKVITHRPVACRGCGAGLDEAVVVGATVRQVFDVPDPRVVVTEHRAQRRRCGCGCETTATFPAAATAPACYGPSIKAHALYLMCAQHLPRERGAEALADMFGVTVSTGTLDNWMREAAGALVGFLAVVAASLKAAPVVHADETSVRSGKGNVWIHVCSNAWLTLLWASKHRHHEGIKVGPLADYHGIVVHDRLVAYFAYGGGHALCNAHVLRNLNELLINRKQRDWARAFIGLIVDTKAKVDTAQAAGKHQLSAYQRRSIRKRWDLLCVDAARAAPEPVKGTKLYGTDLDARRLANALAKHRDEFLAYTADFNIPFDNNQAERDLRMAKLQAKVSGEFRSLHGAQRFAAIRSYISTTRKHDLRPHQHIKQLFTPQGAWLPAPTT